MLGNDQQNIISTENASDIELESFYLTFNHELFFLFFFAFSVMCAQIIATDNFA